MSFGGLSNYHYWFIFQLYISPSHLNSNSTHNRREWKVFIILCISHKALLISEQFLSLMFNVLHPALVSFISDWHSLYRICSSESDVQLTWLTDFITRLMIKALKCSVGFHWSPVWTITLVSAPLIWFSALGLRFTGVPCSNVLACFCPVWRAQDMLIIFINRLSSYIFLNASLLLLLLLVSILRWTSHNSTTCSDWKALLTFSLIHLVIPSMTLVLIHNIFCKYATNLLPVYNAMCMTNVHMWYVFLSVLVVIISDLSDYF